MATTHKDSKARAGKNPMVKGKNEKVSVRDYWQLLDYRTYLRGLLFASPRLPGLPCYLEKRNPDTLTCLHVQPKMA